MGAKKTLLLLMRKKTLLGSQVSNFPSALYFAVPDLPPFEEGHRPNLIFCLSDALSLILPQYASLVELEFPFRGSKY